MFYLFILESIGTSELLLIGLVALVVLGPRKLPQMARTIGKTMADLRRSTSDFKSTWEREVNFDEEKNNANKQSNTLQQDPTVVENSIQRINTSRENKIVSPEIKEITQESFSQNFSKEENQIVKEPKIEKVSANKHDWL
ncbi:MAG: Sec-independent protein translocase protein TatB [Acidobacteria bacterium]|nr:Sec-independent protein translocase protein TatB [Acidobacteriota bacterium]MCA1638478.1 Sec-independent protein translocase protein TatB [Acidobacteriota bacterium]